MKIVNLNPDWMDAFLHRVQCGTTTVDDYLRIRRYMEELHLMIDGLYALLTLSESKAFDIDESDDDEHDVEKTYN